MLQKLTNLESRFYCKSVNPTNWYCSWNMIVLELMYPVVPALDVFLQRHHHGQVLIHIRLTGCLALTPQRIMHELQLTLPWQDVRVTIVEAQWDLRTSIGAAVATNHSDLRVVDRKQGEERQIVVVDNTKTSKHQVGRPATNPSKIQIDRPS